MLVALVEVIRTCLHLLPLAWPPYDLPARPPTRPPACLPAVLQVNGVNTWVDLTKSKDIAKRLTNFVFTGNPEGDETEAGEGMCNLWVLPQAGCRGGVVFLRSTGWQAEGGAAWAA